MDVFHLRSQHRPVDLTHRRQPNIKIELQENTLNSLGNCVNIIINISDVLFNCFLSTLQPPDVHVYETNTGPRAEVFGHTAHDKTAT